MAAPPSLRALPSVIVDTEKVLREADGSVKLVVVRTAHGWKGVSPLGCSSKNRTVRAGEEPEEHKRNEKTAYIPCQIIDGQNSGKKWERMPSWRRSRSGLMKSSMSITQIARDLFHRSWGQGIHGDHQEYSQEIGNSNGPCKFIKNNKNCVSGASNEIKSKLACILEASESTRLRMGEFLPTHHEDHIAGRGDTSLQHYNLVYKFIPMPQTVKFPAAKAAVDKEWEKMEKISAWNLT